jgi:FemAB-related protein (PEP-CTERM system-associated)
MNVLVRLATDQDADSWDQYVLNHLNGLAYHQFAWKRAIEQAYGLKSHYWLAERNGQICGVLPIVLSKKPFSTTQYISLPYCDIGGCLADDENIRTQLLQKVCDFARNEGITKLEMRAGEKIPSAEGKSNLSGKVRMVLELPDSSEKLLLNLKSKLRSQVKKPMRDGLTAVLGGDELIDDFYSVFAENMRDLGSPVHSLRWMKSVTSNFAERAKVGLVYTPDRELAAAGIILLHGDIVSVPWASSLRRYNHLNPNMLLYWSFLAFSADNGFRYFDFGRSTPGEGTYKFKAQWGAQDVSLCWADMLKKSEANINISKSRLRNLLEQIWRRLPVCVATQIGSRVRPYITL